MSEILEMLAKFGGVMLSTTARGWCCHVINAERGINRHCHADTAKAAARRALKAMRKGDYNDEPPTMEDVDEFCNSIDRLMDRVERLEKAEKEYKKAIDEAKEIRSWLKALEDDRI